MKRFTHKDLDHLQSHGKIKDIKVSSRGKSAITIPKPDCRQVRWMYKNLLVWCMEQRLVLEKEYRFHVKRLWRFDFAIPALKLAIEYEGIFSEKSGHTTVDGFLKDVDKYNAAALDGWTVLRYTTKNYTNILQDLKSIVEAKKRINQ
jgi:hypothetical protein